MYNGLQILFVVSVDTYILTHMCTAQKHINIWCHVEVCNYQILENQFIIRQSPCSQILPFLKYKTNRKSFELNTSNNVYKQ